MALSTSSLKFSPASSPISWPIFFIQRETLFGSFSSSPVREDGSARLSSRLSSDFLMAMRETSLAMFRPPQ
jgi:hypothetical protein